MQCHFCRDKIFLSEQIMDLFEHLRRQLDFIARSCEAYDRGYLDEGIRIAQQVRVLIHQTPKSKSLLTQLGATKIRLLTTVSPISSRTIFFDGISTCTFRGDKDGKPGEGTVGARLGGGPPVQKQFPLEAWWNQPLYVRNEIRVTRKNLVLTAANKDGGAHVDSNLTREYQELNAGLWTFVTETTEMKFPDSHFYFLRQLGYEIINSPDLQVMAQTGSIPPFAETPPTDLQPEPLPQPLQIGARELGISDEELNRFVAECRRVVTLHHYELLWQLYSSSPGGFTNPLGSFEKAVASGYPGNISDWLFPLVAMGLLDPRLQRLPRGGNQTMYAISNRGRAFVAAAVRNGS
jgi:hypothetical protein